MRSFIATIVTFITCLAQAQPQSPEAYLGYTLGDQFTRHHQVVNYFEHASQESEKVKLTEYGRTYEDRPLLLAFVSTEENLKKLEEIRKDNLKRAGLMDGTPKESVSIVWLSYNVHGNESVSTEASMATLYELIRPESDKQEWLENTVVVIDPCINPDGRERYVNFYWEKGNQPYHPNPDSWEHHEPWPGGRANHYLFDLNRDWAWQSQIESQQRMAVYNQWLPQIHVDFHEQGVNAPYYFAPAAKPFHELITDWQRDFQVAIGKNHARYFDENNWLYFTKQYFDLLYPSYGDTYPTYNGAIGMTYEQGGSGRAGLGVLKQEGDTLTLADRIAHHYTTGLSTIEVTVNNHERVLSEFEKFFRQTPSGPYKSYVLKNDGNQDKMKALMTWLDKQGIQYGSGDFAKSISGYHYGTGRIKTFKVAANDLVISTNQPKSVLASVLFEPKTKLEDSLTYDITAWSIPYAYGLEAYATSTPLSVRDISLTGEEVTALDEDVYGYAFKWNGMDDAVFLGQLLQNDIKVRLVTKPMEVEGELLKRGSFIVTARDNPNDSFHEKLSELIKLHQRKRYAIKSGFVTSGPDLGSDDVSYLKAPKVALVGGPGTSSLNYGAIWHFFEQNLQYPVTTISTDYFSRVDLRDYQVLILPNGWYSSFDEEDVSGILEWVKNGGRLIAIQGAIDQIEGQDGISLSLYNSKTEQTEFEARAKAVEGELKLVPTADRERYEIRDYVAGAVYKVKMDPTHPLAYGYAEAYYSLKTSDDRYGYLPSGNVGIIQNDSDHLSGFAGQLVKERMGQSLVFGVERLGSGQIIYMVDDPLFRSFWYDGKLLFANAVFYVGQ